MPLKPNMHLVENLLDLKSLEQKPTRNPPNFLANPCMDLYL